MARKTFINGLIYVLFVTILCYCECSRSRGTNSRRGGHTTPRSNNHYNQRTTESSIGFENYQRPQSNRQDIGFENVNSRVPANNQPHGGDTYHQSHYNPVSNSNPSAPLPPTYHNTNPQTPGIGFENVHQRVPPAQQPNYPNNGYNNQQPHNTYNNYNNQGAGYHPGNYNPGYHNQYNPPYNSYQPPATYYNPHYSSPGGFPPPIYQPVQQSSGGSILGYAGSFAGGYLIGHLASGGFGHSSDSGDRQYTVHHYHHDANEIPKQISVATNGLMMCNQNQTQGLCVPNTFPICLINGTIMCVTHSTYTTSCGSGNNLSCVVTVLPCVNNTSCNSTSGNFSTTAVYIPCISNVSVSQQNLVNYTSDIAVPNQSVQYCVTAIAEPKKIDSPVSSYITFLQQLAQTAYEMSKANYSMNSTIITSNDRTEITTLLPILNNNETKTEITTLPYRH